MTDCTPILTVSMTLNKTPAKLDAPLATVGFQKIKYFLGENYQ